MRGQSLGVRSVIWGGNDDEDDISATDGFGDVMRAEGEFCVAVARMARDGDPLSFEYPGNAVVKLLAFKKRSFRLECG